MTFSQFIAFAAVAKHCNVTRAAQALKTSQPAISKLLRSLESRYGIKLLKRCGNGVMLSDQGEEFLAHITPIVEQLKSLEEKFPSDAAPGPSAPLRVGGTYGPAAGVLPTLLALLKKQHPDVEFTLRANPAPMVEEMMRKGHLDLAVTTRETRAAELLSEPFVPMKLTLFAAKGSPLTGKKQLSLDDLDKIPLVIRGDPTLPAGSTERLLGMLLGGARKLNVAMRCESPEAIKLMVQNHHGVGILYHDEIKWAIARGSFAELRIRGLKLVAESFILRHQEEPLSAYAEAFLGLLRDWRDRQGQRPRRTALAHVFAAFLLLPSLLAAHPWAI